MFKKIGLGLGILLFANLAYPLIFQDKISLQKGALIFMQRCVGCHALSYLRYERLNQDLDLHKVQSLQGYIKTNLSKKDAEKWFGNIPPDLSLKARERGKDWIYAYLRGFYFDPTRSFGANNHVLPNTAMPPVLSMLAPEEIEPTLEDLVNFLNYSAEPARLTRYVMGMRVLIFLFIFWLLLVYCMRILDKRLR